MTKADLIDSVAGETELTKRQVAEVVETFLDEIKGALQSGEKVALVPFGSFVVRNRKKREGRNPKTGAKLSIPARRVPAFQAGKALRDAIGGGKSAKRATKARKR